MTEITKPSTLRMRRRVAVLNATGQFLSGDPSTTWSKSVESIFTDLIFPESVTAADLDQAVIQKKMLTVLATFTKNVKAMKPGKSEALAKIIQDMPRKKKQKKSK